MTSINNLPDGNHQHEQSANIRRKNRKKWKITPRFWMVAAAFFILYMVVSYVSGYIQIARIKSEMRNVQSQIEHVQIQNELLREELQYLQSDEFIEKMAREELGLVNPGETAIRVIPNE